MKRGDISAAGVCYQDQLVSAEKVSCHKKAAVPASVILAVHSIALLGSIFGGKTPPKIIAAHDHDNKAKKTAV